LFLSLLFPSHAALRPASATTAYAAAAAPTVDRIAGTNRFSTATAVADAWSGPVDVVYVVNARNYPDALGASAAAGRDGAPVLLTDQSTIPSVTTSALRRLNPARIVVSGGTGVVSRSVLRQLGSYTRSGTAIRLSGSNRYKTSAALARDYPTGMTRVYLASGQDFPDALSTAALAGSQGAPLLLTRSSSLDSDVAAQLRRIKPREVVVVGRTTSVSSATARAAASYAVNKSPKRVAGANIYDTSRLVAARFPASASTAYVASGEAFPDGLVGAALAARNGAPVLLTPRSRLHQATSRALTTQETRRVHILGGPNAVTNTVRDSIASPAGAMTDYEAQVLSLTNTERRKAGCANLRANAALTVVARNHSADMIARNYFSHTSPDGGTMSDRVNASSYQWRGLAENIAFGQRTPQEVVTAWMNSSGHRRNILNCAYKDLGVGLSYGANGTARPHWTQNFGTPR
ncbi:MAG: cell wall-binding repeat-containing protein, partial [Ornithinimicrobium sp.]